MDGVVPDGLDAEARLRWRSERARSLDELNAAFAAYLAEVDDDDRDPRGSA